LTPQKKNRAVDSIRKTKKEEKKKRDNQFDGRGERCSHPRGTMLKRGNKLTHTEKETSWMGYPELKDSAAGRTLGWRMGWVLQK